MPDHAKYQGGSAGPRRFGEFKMHKNLRELSSADLRAGDVLLAKEWSPHNVESFFIPAAQAAFSRTWGASAASEHALLVVEDGEAKTAQAVSKGVLISTGINKRDHVVYGCDDEQLRWEAVLVAERLGGVGVGEENVEAYNAGQVGMKFRKAASLPSVLFRQKRRGKGANKRLQQVYDHVYGGQPLGDVRVVCSEFVVTCYEVAAMRLSEQSETPVKAFDVDPRAISAKALEGLLQVGSGPFRLSGRYKGTIPYTAKQEKEAEAARRAAWDNMSIGRKDENNVPDAVLRARAARAAQGQ
jgi:hypothetical protein